MLKCQNPALGLEKDSLVSTLFSSSLSTRNSNISSCVCVRVCERAKQQNNYVLAQSSEKLIL